MLARLFLCLLVVTPGIAAARGPNIVVILADDLGYGDLSCYRDGATPTPHCDRLAAEGMRFTDAHSPSSVCTPTRYGVLTGRYAWRTWLKDWVHNERMPLLIEDDRQTLPSVLQDAGYVTGCVGKWHLGWGRQMRDYQRGVLVPGVLEAGFDESFVVPFSHNSSPSMEHFVRGRSIVGLQAGESLADEDVVERLRRSLTETATDLSQEAVRFIEDQAVNEKPFFLYYATTNIHFPITPHGRFITKPARNRQQKTLSDFDGFVREFDWAVGEILATVDRLPDADNTIVIVTSDNGGATRFGSSNGPWRGEKAEIYEGGHRVPMIVRWPKTVPAATTCDQLVCLTDLAPTLSAVAPNTELTIDFAPDGIDISHALRNPHAKIVDRAVIHHSIAGMFAIRVGDWKLIDGLGNGKSRFAISLKDTSPEPTIDADGNVKDWTYRPAEFPRPNQGEPARQLYNLAVDPTESINRSASEPTITAGLDTRLRSIIQLDPTAEVHRSTTKR